MYVDEHFFHHATEKMMFSNVHNKLWLAFLRHLYDKNE